VRKPRADATFTVVYFTDGRWFRAPGAHASYADAAKQAAALSALGFEARVHPTRALEALAPEGGWA
jgi:hypothetical protein